MKRGLAFAAGILVAAIGVGAVWYQADQGHRLMHAGLAGRDEPIRLALSKAPRDAGLWELLGEAYANQSRYAEAIQAYDRSIALAPHDETTWWMKGIAEVCRENPEGVGSVAVRLDALDASSGAEFRKLAKTGCCAFGKGCAEKRGAVEHLSGPARQLGTRPLFALERDADVDRTGGPATPRSPASFPCLRCGTTSAPNTYRGSPTVSTEARGHRCWAGVRATAPHVLETHSFPHAVPLNRKVLAYALEVRVAS